MTYIKLVLLQQINIMKMKQSSNLLVQILGHLTLNQSCITTDQCLGLPYASCLGGTCSCIEGYAASSSSNCVLGMNELWSYLFVMFIG